MHFSTPQLFPPSKNKFPRKWFSIFLLSLPLLLTAALFYVLPLPDGTVWHQNLTSVEQWGVSSGHPSATRAGMEILNQGGNAIDAAVAVAYALGVAEPYACGLGGGGEMIIYRSHDHSVRVIDYRDTSPSSYSFSALGTYVVGIPGFVKGMDYLLKTYGTFSRAKAIAPAIRYAEKGVIVSKTLAHFLSRYNGVKVFPQKTPQFFNRRRPLRTGEILYQYDLAAQMRRISAHGSGAFYQGSCAVKLLTAMNRTSHLYSEHDLANYRVRDTPAISAPFKTFKVYTVPSPGGGIPLLQMLRLAEISGAVKPGVTEKDRLPLLLKAAEIAYNHRRSFLGDVQFQTAEPFLNDAFLKNQWNENVKRQALPENDETESTTHFVVVDRWGNWVSSTQTISDFFGSGQYVNGFFLNNSLNKFSNLHASPNAAAPDKRPFSYIAPCLIFQSGRPVLALGSPGGYRIPSILSQMLIYHLVDGYSLKNAVKAERYYLSDRRKAFRTVFFERNPSSTIRALLIKEGFHVAVSRNPIQYGAIQALEFDNKSGLLIGVADWRREGNFVCRKIKVKKP